MTLISLAIILVAAYGLYQVTNQRKVHEQLDQERRRRYMQRYT